MYDLNEILIHSIECKASDIHLSVGKAPNYRIDGVLHTKGEEKLLPDDVKNLILPLLDKRHEEELEKTGQTDFAYAIPHVGRFRVNVFKQRGTLASVMRALPFDIPEPEKLGLPPEVVAVTEKRRGLILVTGPTGSGKSTTLASLIQVINRTRADHIITLEDPIEYLHRHDKTIDRIIDVFPPDQQQQIRIQLAAVLECVVSQQLLKCLDGNGRVAALEVLFANNAVRNLIREGKTFQITSVIQTSKRLGMQTMDDALYDLYMRRMIDGEAAISYAQDPVAMNKKINFV